MIADESIYPITSKITTTIIFFIHRLRCAVERRTLSVGKNPTRQLSLQPVAIGAVVEATKRPKPSM